MNVASFESGAKSQYNQRTIKYQASKMLEGRETSKLNVINQDK